MPIIPSNIPATLVLLPKYSQADKTFVGAQATVSGFGRTSDTSNNVSPFMEYVTLKVIQNKECFDLYGKRIVTDNVLCAKGIDKMYNACLGGKKILCLHSKNSKSYKSFVFELF